MARTTATNFSGGLQFPYATAATDLFKKEDVQTLALAVDGHDHSTGKGLVLPASAIPPITSAMIQDGSITSADIANGTITPDDLALGAATSLLGVYQGGPTFSSTAVSTFVATPVTAAGTTGLFANSFVRVTVGCSVSHSAVGGVVYLAIYRNGTNITGNMGIYQAPVAGQNLPMFLQWEEASPGGATTYQLYMYNSVAGTMALTAGAPATMHVMEFRR